ncbi:hypothetical protein M8C21_003713, partial [Ambrosia artemisiifolia]
MLSAKAREYEYDLKLELYLTKITKEERALTDQSIPSLLIICSKKLTREMVDE